MYNVYSTFAQEKVPKNKRQDRENLTAIQNGGLDRDLNPGPLAPEARIIPLDHQAYITMNFNI